MMADFGLDSKISFGKKYNGKTLLEVLNENVSWIVWMLKEKPWFTIDDNADELMKNSLFFECLECTIKERFDDYGAFSEWTTSTGSCRHCGSQRYSVVNYLGHSI